ncbi:hypothetical protein [Metabacillus sp. Hm71]|uniref:hypothetical protein n=1 Tax=Metabacillus sp. Hm71 TaxID=3450743 RepID=UPI003F41BA21
MENNLPKKVYKFMEPQYLELLEKSQNIYINYLNNYDEDIHGSERGDNNEGIVYSELNLGAYTFGSKINPNFESSFKKLTPFIVEDGVTFTGGTFITKFTRRYFYNYSVCREYDEKVKKEFGGATLIIEDFPNFLNYLNRKMFKLGKELVLAKSCVYKKDRKSFFSEKSNKFYLDFPALVKEKKYAYQKEYRLLWRNIDGTKIKEPILVHSPEALKQCKFEY